MLIETIMYFALGFLAAGLLALMVMPAIWRRAVRLTKNRIEAATPMTLSEFRADKDQLRAEFALSTRRLERHVDSLRTRLAGQVSDINQRKADLARIRVERDEQLTIIGELETREEELRERIIDLERAGTDLAQRLRMRDRDYAELETELEEMRNGGGAAMSNFPDLDKLFAELNAERQRATFFEDQARALLARLETAEHNSTEAAQAVSELRTALARRDDETTSSNTALTEAEARIAAAEQKLNAMLLEQEARQERVPANDQAPANGSEIAYISRFDEPHDDEADHSNGELLAQRLSLEEEMARLRDHVSDVENAVLHDWETERLNQAHLREKLNDIASEVSRLVYAVDEEVAVVDDGESLFDKVRRFAGEEFGTELAPVGEQSGGGVSDRMTALRELRARHDG